MEAPGRRVIEEQEPSGSITLQCLGERSHTPTEWRLSDCGCMIKKKEVLGYGFQGSSLHIFSWSCSNIRHL